MAYLRWTDSDFYVFWKGSSADDTKENERLAVWFDIQDQETFTYKELTDEYTRDNIMQHYSMKKITSKELRKLEGAINSFISDVEKSYEST